MARKVFYSFHYKPDSQRAALVRNIRALEGNQSLSDNDWEEVVGGGDSAIQKWIDGQMSGKSCAVVLIGSATAGRPWIEYEIKKAWADRKGIVGIYIHNLNDFDSKQSSKGKNPFAALQLGGKTLSSIVNAYDPPYTTSKYVYDHISKNIESWVEEAISIRQAY